MATLTVFTPTYNRAQLLERCYESLKKQSLKDFVWLIVDDGSTDNTYQIVQNWMCEPSQFELQYIHKENGGLHTAYNAAIEAAETELCVCIDSDDFMPHDAVEKIINFWNENGDPQYAGIIGLDYDMNGVCIGDELPNKKSIDLVDLCRNKYHIKNGDRKLVIRTDLYKKVAPMPVFPGEKNFNPQYMHIQIALEREFLVLNECLCIVDYQPTGMSNSMFKQYYNSPNSFAEIRLQDLSLSDTSLFFKLKKSIHYCSSCILAKRKRCVLDSPCKLITALAYIPGIALSIYIRFKNK